jgi:integrase
MSTELRMAIDKARMAGGDNVRAITLFHTRGKPVSYFSVRDQFDVAKKAAAVEDMHIHDIRAKSLTDAKRQGKDAQKLAGHTDAKMTARYIRQREVDVAESPSFGQSKDGGAKNA